MLSVHFLHFIALLWITERTTLAYPMLSGQLASEGIWHRWGIGGWEKKRIQAISLSPSSSPLGDFFLGCSSLVGPAPTKLAYPVQGPPGEAGPWALKILPPSITLQIKSHNDFSMLPNWFNSLSLFGFLVLSLPI